MIEAKPRIIGYCLVSSDNLDADRQVSGIIRYCKQKALGYPMIVTETIAGASIIEV